ncbi:MAG: hypothetical protein V3S56_08360 [Gemmatimonadota bacterium]
MTGHSTEYGSKNRIRKEDEMLWILIGVTVAVGLLLGLLAKMPPKQIAAQCLVMSGAAFVFYSLVNLL